MAFLAQAAQGASLVASLLGTQMSVDAARYQGAAEANKALIEAENAARSAEARAEADEFNAKVSEQQAISEEQRAGAEAHDFRRAQSARQAAQRARSAASGVALEGSPLLVDQAIFQEIEFSVQRIVHGGQVVSGRLRNQATLQRYSADVERMNADTARKTGRISADYAIQAGDIKARGARIAGLGDTARILTGIGTTLTGKSSSWGSSLNPGAPLSLNPRDYS
jgi:hypothetical protein